jgi:hypothetical protein
LCIDTSLAPPNNLGLILRTGDYTQRWGFSLCERISRGDYTFGIHFPSLSLYICGMSLKIKPNSVRIWFLSLQFILMLSKMHIITFLNTFLNPNMNSAEIHCVLIHPAMGIFPVWKDFPRGLYLWNTFSLVIVIYLWHDLHYTSPDNNRKTVFVNVLSLLDACLLFSDPIQKQTNKTQKQKSCIWPFNEHFWQVWLKSVQRFQRRRFKCEKLKTSQACRSSTKWLYSQRNLTC